MLIQKRKTANENEKSKNENNKKRENAKTVFMKNRYFNYDMWQFIKNENSFPKNKNRKN